MGRNFIHSMFAHYVARSYNLEHDKNENLWFTYLQNQMKFYPLKSDHWFWQHINYRDKQLKPIVDYIESDVKWFCFQHSMPKDVIDYSKTKLSLHRFDRENYMAKFKDPNSFNSIVHLNTEPQEILKNPLHISTYMIMVRYYEKEKK